MRKTILVVTALALLPVARAQASPVTLTFTGLQCLEPVGNFYNGLKGGFGTGPTGPSDGITFSSGALALQDFTTPCGGNFSGEPSTPSIMFLHSDLAAFVPVSATMDMAAGFASLSFSYSARSDTLAGSAEVFSGLDGTGLSLGSLPLPPLPACTSTALFCTWKPMPLTFAGTGHSVVFSGESDQIGFDDITVNSGTSTAPVPEPTSLLLLGSGLIVGARRARRLFGARRGE